jgi:hypothetical protein
MCAKKRIPEDSVLISSITAQDVDVVVLNFDDDDDIEEIKEGLVRNYTRFYLRRSTNPNNTYKVLYYSLPAGRNNKRRSCKVDIVDPDALDLPPVPSRRVADAGVPDVPVMPLLALILTKLKGWEDHRDSHRDDMYQKHYVDVEDIEELLDLAVNSYEVHRGTEKWMPKWFLRDARRRIRDYLNEHPETRADWQALGF